VICFFLVGKNLDIADDPVIVLDFGHPDQGTFPHFV
jgi:hypothetical protein